MSKHRSKKRPTQASLSDETTVFDKQQIAARLDKQRKQDAPPSEAAPVTEETVASVSAVIADVLKEQTEASPAPAADESVMNDSSPAADFDSKLVTPVQGQELTPDLEAMSSAGLSSLNEPVDDREIEENIQQNMARFTDDASAPSASPAADQTVVSTDPTAPEEEEEDFMKNRQRRRPRKKRADNFFGASHILSTFVWLLIVVLVGVSLGNLVWVCASDVLAFGRENREVTITINPSDTMDQITDKLVDAGLVKYGSLFKIYANVSDAKSDILAGTYTLNTMYDYHALVDYMSTRESQATVDVVIPEGYSCAQIFDLLEEKEVCSVEDMEKWAAEGELSNYWFLEGVERGSKYCLEGFLFPDTYEFYTNDDPQRVLEKMLDNFGRRFSQELRDSVVTLNERLAGMMADNGYDQDYIDSHKLSVQEVVTVASLIEKESANTLESYTISSVIYNRLTNAAEYPYLNIDAAILYALGEHKEHLSQADLEIDSPYNTYLHKGLTPGPICNPGLYSLNAALDPDSSNYHYYAMDPETGAHHFSETMDEHNAFLDSLGD